MNNKSKELIKKLTDLLINNSFHFLRKNFYVGSSVTEIMDVVVSAHISSLFNVMRTIAKGHPDSEIIVEKFIVDLEKAIIKINPIKDIEKLT